MKIIRSASAMQRVSLHLKKKKTIAFVPTMGYLHAGHLKLVTVAKKHADIIIASIFINPMQFGANEDLTRYPRDEKGDLVKLKKAGVDYVYFPTIPQMYPGGFQTYVTVEQATQGMCGLSRPTHFRGVTTVVCKLFNIVQPDVSIFGKKDYQQYRVIETMVRDLNLPIKIIGVETEREKDGLALSSRNAYLNPEERALGVGLFQALKAVRDAARAQPQTSDVLCRIFAKHLPQDPRVRIDYVECRDALTLDSLATSRPKRTLVAAAVFVGKTRLIDNIVF